MGIVSWGFQGRSRRSDQKLPPGQYLTDDFPVLSAGPTPRVNRDRWEFVVATETGTRHRWTWPELLADVETAADYALVHAYGGYTTNLPLGDTVLTQIQAALKA